MILESLIQGRWLAVWQRNFYVWLKMFVPSILANFGEPVLYLLTFGYGFGYFIGTLEGVPYIIFLASGILCASAMQTATFECLYSAYTRMAIQQTWGGILATPLNVADVLLGEIIWAATKSLLSVITILLVAAAFGMVLSWYAIWAIPTMFLLAFCFAAMAISITALANGYDFFLYYVILVITPIALLSGVFFPLENLPLSLQLAVYCLPLIHAVELVRPLFVGQIPFNIGGHLSVIAIYSIIATYVAFSLLKRRLES